MLGTENKEKKLIVGTVISDGMDKTIVVKTIRTYRHSEFKKVLRSFKKYKVHDEKNSAKVGDSVEFYETRPLSKTKYMTLFRVIKTEL